MIRIILVIGAAPWTAYDGLVGSWAGIVNELLFIISNVIALYRYSPQRR